MPTRRLCASRSSATVRSHCLATMCGSCCPPTNNAPSRSTPPRWEFPLSAEEARRRLFALLGDVPPRMGVPAARLIEATPKPGHDLERWSLDLNGRDPVPALLVMPRGRDLRGVVLYCHAHGNRFDIGKDELLTGRPAIG